MAQMIAAPDHNVVADGYRRLDRLYPGSGISDMLENVVAHNCIYTILGSRGLVICRNMQRLHQTMISACALN